jgi:hypothetical protein
MNGSGDYITGDINAMPKTGDSPAGRECVHCHRRCGTVAGGHARIGGLSVCSKPTVSDRPDCYRMFYYRFHPLIDCPDCMVRSS